MTAPRNINKVTIAKQPDLYGQVPYEYRKQPVITETTTVELRDLRQTLEFIQRTADRYIIDGGSPALLERSEPRTPKTDKIYARLCNKVMVNNYLESFRAQSTSTTRMQQERMLSVMLWRLAMLRQYE